MSNAGKNTNVKLIINGIESEEFTIPPGKSTYDIAKENGYSGTEEEYLTVTVNSTSEIKEQIFN